MQGQWWTLNKQPIFLSFTANDMTLTRNPGVVLPPVTQVMTGVVLGEVCVALVVSLIKAELASNLWYPLSHAACSPPWFSRESGE